VNQPTVLLPLSEVERRIGRKKSWIYVSKEFPRPVKLGKENRWLEHEVEAFIQRLIEARPST
jgi:predicted DNA-binding transcriptional regulator AlpA